MSIAEFTIKNKLLSVIAILIFFFGGWSAYQNMARFEDPEFTIRIAQINTPYPGASPLEVAEEVTDPLEKALQQLQEVETITSTSLDGMSEIQVEIKYEFSKSKSDLQLIWSKVRNKMKDAERSLPPGAGSPIVNDDFGDVFGLYYFLTGEGYDLAELRSYAKDLQSTLLKAEGVAKVAIGGEASEAIFVEISREKIAALEVAVSNVYNVLAAQNSVVAAGDLRIGDQRIVIDPTGAIDSVESIRNTLVSTSSAGKLIYLSDVARVWRGFQTPETKVFRYNRQPALAIGVSNILGANVVKMGEAVDAKLAEAEGLRPIGMELHEYYHQGKIVEASVKDFVVNVIAALVIVIVTLLIFMGFRSALVIGTVLLLTIMATLLTMEQSGIPMHRISLGALIIALGMMVDNAIVVTEGILVGVQRGSKKLDIAKSIVTQTKWPLLGGTLVGIIAFAPIGFAPGSTAEYTGHLFWVILISLLYSWLFAITATPLFCYWLFPESADGQQSSEKEEASFYRHYRSLVGRALSSRWLVVGAAFGMFLASMWGFKFVKSGFFPESTSPQFVVDFWLPQGTDIDRTRKDAVAIEAFVSGMEGVDAVQTLIGAGGLRYMLIYDGQSPNSSYAQLLVKVDDSKRIGVMIPEVQAFVDTNFPNAQAKVWRFVLGPGGGSKIEAVFKGPDPAVLRRLANEAKAIMVADGGALSIKDDWRQPVPVIEPIYSESKGRKAGVSREDLAVALQANFSGRSVGAYREGNDLIPIIARAPESERIGVQDITSVLVASSTTGRVVPVEQVVDGFKTIWRDGLVKREDRTWTIKAQCDPLPGELASDLQARMMEKISAIEIPGGYVLEWGGEYGDSKESNDSLASTLPLGFGAMVLVVVVLFGALRQPIVIWLAVPLSLIGVVVGLVATGTPLEFMAILGLLSLSGLLIKNAIVLVDQIDFEIRNGVPRYDAVVNSAVSRMRPVMMGTLTTVLGVIPLFLDAFFKSMAVVLVFGLTFATVLTLVVVPALYTLFFRIRLEESDNV
ncbi:efflux RND transporter permease subunit [Pelagicoccus mobilis]|uniref:Efflux RND transporter permease subunit n=1 Tax=Pelagicoccus mobilis TaxID=415221 RepID=A0A934VLC0_9BACT|nr:efflux RND transporter permease subunit [Pelagicoccus mobilis]MBK1877596.1 efflux RND transporter permease subunit [Pelagicoccus mobilis]